MKLEKMKLTLASLGLALACMGATAQAAQTYVLQAGGQIQYSQLSWGDVVQCNGSITPPPPPPPPPMCAISSVASTIQNIRGDIGRLSNYQCPRGGFRYCSNELEQHSVGDAKDRLYRDFSNAKQQLERECSNPGCSPRDVQAAMRDLEDTIRQALSTPMRYRDDGGKGDFSTQMLNTDAGLHANCRTWGRP